MVGRHIYKERFYGRRKGQTLSHHKKNLLREILPRFCIAIDDTASGTLNPKALFDFPVKDVWLEIGFGKGEHLALQASTNPEIGFIGCDPFINGVASLIDIIHKKNLENIRIYPGDVRDIFPLLKKSSLGRVFLLHPDPWPKKRHAKRRFIHDDNLNMLAKLMKPGSKFRIGTDHPTYMTWTMIKMQNRNDFVWTAEHAADWMIPPADWPETRYAAKAKSVNRKRVYFTYVRASV